MECLCQGLLMSGSLCVSQYWNTGRHETFQVCQSISKSEGVDCKPLMLQLALSHVGCSGFNSVAVLSTSPSHNAGTLMSKYTIHCA